MGPKHTAKSPADLAALEKRLARAVEDVLSGDVTAEDAARNRGVSPERLREALHSTGWVARTAPSPKRRTFGNGRRHGT